MQKRAKGFYQANDGIKWRKGSVYLQNEPNLFDGQSPDGKDHAQNPRRVSDVRIKPPQAKPMQERGSEILAQRSKNLGFAGLSVLNNDKVSRGLPQSQIREPYSKRLSGIHKPRQDIGKMTVNQTKDQKKRTLMNMLAAGSKSPQVREEQLDNSGFADLTDSNKLNSKSRFNFAAQNENNSNIANSALNQHRGKQDRGQAHGELRIPFNEVVVFGARKSNHILESMIDLAEGDKENCGLRANNARFQFSTLRSESPEFNVNTSRSNSRSRKHLDAYNPHEDVRNASPLGGYGSRPIGAKPAGLATETYSDNSPADYQRSKKQDFDTLRDNDQYTSNFATEHSRRKDSASGHKSYYNVYTRQYCVKPFAGGLPCEQFTPTEPSIHRPATQPSDSKAASLNRSAARRKSYLREYNDYLDEFDCYPVPSPKLKMLTEELNIYNSGKPSSEEGRIGSRMVPERAAPEQFMGLECEETIISRDDSAIQVQPGVMNQASHFSFTNLITGVSKQKKSGNSDKNGAPALQRQAKTADLSFNRYFHEIAQKGNVTVKNPPAQRATPDKAMISERLSTSPIQQTYSDISMPSPVSREEAQWSPPKVNLEQEIQIALQQAEPYYETDPRHLERNHPSITWLMRATLVEWMMEVCRDFMLKRETFHYSIEYVDRFLTATKSLRREEYQLVGLVAMFIASKMEEVIPQSIKSFAASAQFGYSEEQIQQVELKMCQALKWKLTPPTIFNWGGICMKAWDSFIDAYPELNGVKFLQPELKSMCRYREVMLYLDTTLFDVLTLQYKMKALVLSTIYLVLGQEFKQFSLTQIQQEFGQSSQYAFQDTNGFNQLFGEFLDNHCSVALAELVPSIQYVSGFFNLPVEIDLPSFFHQVDDFSKLAVNYHEVLALQTFHPKAKQFATGRSRRR